MKQIILFFVIFAPCFVGCVKEKVKKDIVQEPTTASTPKFDDIISESGLRLLLLTAPDHTWQELDAFYMEGIVKHRDHPSLFNFKCAAIQGLTDYYKVLDDKSAHATERIAFFAQEMAELKNCSPEVLYRMLIRLQGYWDSKKIAEVAEMGYKNAESLFNAMSKSIPPYEVRKKGMENLLTLFESNK